MMEANQYIQLKSVFEQYSHIDKPTRTYRQTLMMVSGYPHFENVTSNILAFLFNDTEEHKMRNLWIRSLLDGIQGIDTSSILNTTVDREVMTKKGNRIDLVVYSDSCVIGIENKLYSYVYNDLDDYKQTITNYASHSNIKPINILLSLHDEHDIAENHGFYNITYEKLFLNVKKYIGEYIDDADNTWIVYTKDFIYTIENLVEENSMDKEFAKFLYDNKENIISFLSSVDTYKREIKATAEKLYGLLDLDSRLTGHPYKVFCYNDKIEPYSCVCIDIKRPDGRTLTVETFSDCLGWHITLFDRLGNESGKILLEAQLTKEGINYTPINGDECKLEVESCKYTNDFNEVLNKVNLAVDLALQIL